MKITILGAGLAGLSCSYHLGHENCVIFEEKSHDGGHIYSHLNEGCTWDEGPHISFTKNKYVRNLFDISTEGKYLEYEAIIGNWYRGNWIPHPAQTNLFAVPKDLAERCLNDFLESREGIDHNSQPKDYSEWLERAFGKSFAEEFPAKYTKKYWTCEPKDLGTDWIGERIHYPDVESVKKGFYQQPLKSGNYISTVRYPLQGGFYKYSTAIRERANTHFNKKVSAISLKEKLIRFEDGSSHQYEYLINTIPIDQFVRHTIEAGIDIRRAADNLSCTKALLINITGNNTKPLPYNWLYVYDEDFLSTRITQNQLLSPNNMTIGKVGLQVEVYSSKYKRMTATPDEVKARVLEEVHDMKLIETVDKAHTQNIEYANVIFDHKRKDSLDQILQWLSSHGLNRSDDDLDAITDWEQNPTHNFGTINLAGRFGEWKYHWSDDCVLRGKQIANSFKVRNLLY